MGEQRHSRAGDGAPMQPLRTTPFRLGEWGVYPSLNRVARDDRWVQVEPRVMHVLVCLAGRPGEVFSRETLLDIVWTDVVVCEEALTRTISELRRIFQDDPRESRYIETIRKGGYRLIAPVSPLPEPPPGGGAEVAAGLGEPRAHASIAGAGDGGTGVVARPAESASERAAGPAPDPAAEPITEPRAEPGAEPGAGRPARRFTLAGRPAHGRLAFSAGLLLIVALAATVGPRLRAHGAPRAVTLEGVPFTTYPGSERYPALSPDGTQVAFAWDNGQAGRFSIYVKQRHTESPLRLTESPGSDAYPAWSPDGSTVAFVRRHAGGFEIHAVPSIGGVSRRLLALEEEPCGLDWSPDGASIAIGWAQRPGRARGIALLSLETLEVRALTEPPPFFGGDGLPAFAPDGRSIAFRRVDAAMMDGICLVDVRGGEPRRLGPSRGAISGLDWAPGGRHIVFAASSGGNSGLARMATGNQSLTRLVTKGEQALRPTVSPGGRRLVYEEVSYHADVYRIELRTQTGVLTPQPLIASTRVDAGASFSPDGSRLAFLSNRGGTREIWICAADGSQPRQLTRIGGAWITSPCWSPDGRWLAFSADSDDRFVVHVIDAEGGRPRRLAGGGRHEIATLWSADGEWIYYDAEREDGWDIRRAHPDGTGASVVVADGRGAMAQSADGLRIHHLATRDGGVWCTTLGDGRRERLVDGQTAAGWGQIASVGAGAYFTRSDGAGALLGYCDYSTGAIDSLLQLPLYSGGGLALSPDGATLLYDHIDRVERDLILVEGFR